MSATPNEEPERFALVDRYRVRLPAFWTGGPREEGSPLLSAIVDGAAYMLFVYPGEGAEGLARAKKGYAELGPDVKVTRCDAVVDGVSFEGWRLEGAPMTELSWLVVAHGDLLSTGFSYPVGGDAEKHTPLVLAMVADAIQRGPEKAPPPPKKEGGFWKKLFGGG